VHSLPDLTLNGGASPTYMNYYLGFLCGLCNLLFIRVIREICGYFLQNEPNVSRRSLSEDGFPAQYQACVDRPRPKSAFNAQKSRTQSCHPERSEGSIQKHRFQPSIRDSLHFTIYNLQYSIAIPEPKTPTKNDYT